MGTIVRFKDPRRAREEASSWLVSLDEGLAPEERRQFDEWLRERANRDALVEQARLWDDLNVLAELSGIYPLESHRAPRMAGLASRLYVAAGLVGVVLAGGLLFSSLRGSDAPRTAEARPNGTDRQETPAGDRLPGTVVRSYQTAVGEHLETRLPDGSVLRINTDTELNVHYTADERLIVLKRGEASFDVEHDAARPFRVDAGRRILEALGTAFNVQRVPDGDIELTVVEGRVLVRTPTGPAARNAGDGPLSFGSSFTVAAGQLAAIDQVAEHVTVLAAQDVEARMSWQRGALVFRGEPLGLALAEVERYTNVRFRLKDSALAAIQVGGYFRTGDVDGVVLALRESFGIDARWISETEIELMAR